MKKILTAAAFVALSSATAFAADLPVYTKAPPPIVEPIYNWTGFYIGGHIGYGWGSDDWTRINGSGGTQGNGQVHSFDPSGFLAGGQVGYNFQVNHWVFGIEGEMSWSDVKGGFVGTNDNGPATWHTDVNWIATLAGRIGYAFDRSLLYVKGGAAWADEGYNHPSTGGQGQAFDYTGGATRSGWLVGAGFEYGFAPNWSARIEYNYIGLGTDRITLNDVSGRFVTFDMNQNIQTVKLGVNYRFGGGPVVAKY